MLGINRDSLSCDTLENISTIKVSLIPTVEYIRRVTDQEDTETVRSLQASTLSAFSTSYLMNSLTSNSRISKLGSNAAREYVKFNEILNSQL